MHQPPPLTSSLFVLCLSALWGNFSHSSVGKKSICNAGDPGSIPGSGRSSGEGIVFLGFPCCSAAKASTCNGMLGSIPGLGRSPGEKGYPLQYSGLENSMGCVVHAVAKSRTLLSNFHFLSSSPQLPSYIIFHEVFLLPPSS